MELKVESVKLPIREISNWREISITPIEDASYVTALGCPICEKTNTQSIIEVRAYKQRGLDLHFCSNCEHIFFKRYPEQAWYTAYYKEDKDVNIQINASYFRRLKHFIRNRPLVYDLWLKKLVSKHRSAATMHSMLNEILTDSAREYFVNTGLSWLAESKIKNVLDIGCGFGDTLLFYKSRGLSALGIEASPKRVEVCRNKGLNVNEVSVSDIMSIRNSGPFDLISSTHVLEHIVDLTQHLNQVLELSHDRTYLYFEVPNASQENLFSRVFNPSHLHVFSLRSLVYLLARFGFTVIRISQDLNTHVLAVRSDSDNCSFSYNGTTGQGSYQAALSQLKRNVGQRLRISYANMNYHTVITNLVSGEEIFRYDPGFHTRPLPENNIFALEGLLENDECFSVNSLVLLHKGDKAPIIW